MNIKEGTIHYFLKIITLVFGILLLFNIVNAIDTSLTSKETTIPAR